jgi:hypothetical protein
MGKTRIRDPGSGINIPDPQHCLLPIYIAIPRSPTWDISALKSDTGLAGVMGLGGLAAAGGATALLGEEKRLAAASPRLPGSLAGVCGFLVKSNIADKVGRRTGS